MSKKIVGKFCLTKPGQKWAYAKIQIKTPKGWTPYDEYNYGPSLYWNGSSFTVVVRKKIKK